jgi:hypothetical protein
LLFFVCCFYFSSLSSQTSIISLDLNRNSLCYFTFHAKRFFSSFFKSITFPPMSSLFLSKLRLKHSKSNLFHSMSSLFLSKSSLKHSNSSLFHSMSSLFLSKSSLKHSKSNLFHSMSSLFLLKSSFEHSKLSHLSSHSRLYSFFSTLPPNTNICVTRNLIWATQLHIYLLYKLVYTFVNTYNPVFCKSKRIKHKYSYRNLIIPFFARQI